MKDYKEIIKIFVTNDSKRTEVLVEYCKSHEKLDVASEQTLLPESLLILNKLYDNIVKFDYRKFKTTQIVSIDLDADDTLNFIGQVRKDTFISLMINFVRDHIIEKYNDKKIIVGCPFLTSVTMISEANKPPRIIVSGKIKVV